MKKLLMPDRASVAAHCMWTYTLHWEVSIAQGFSELNPNLLLISP